MGSALKMKLNSKDQLCAGMTRTEVLVVIGVVIVLVLVALPLLATFKRKMAKVDCIDNLRALECATLAWAQDHDNKYAMELSSTNGGVREFVLSGSVVEFFTMLSNDIPSLRTPPEKALVCPTDRARTVAKSFDPRNENISYFINADFSRDNPATVLMGDRNLMTNGAAVGPGRASLTANTVFGWTAEMHQHRGILSYADGSEQEVAEDSLQSISKISGLATNRLAVP